MVSCEHSNKKITDAPVKMIIQIAAFGIKNFNSENKRYTDSFTECELRWNTRLCAYSPTRHSPSPSPSTRIFPIQSFFHFNKLRSDSLSVTIILIAHHQISNVQHSESCSKHIAPVNRVCNVSLRNFVLMESLQSVSVRLQSIFFKNVERIG